MMRRTFPRKPKFLSPASLPFGACIAALLGRARDQLLNDRVVAAADAVAALRPPCGRQMRCRRRCCRAQNASGIFCLSVSVCVHTVSVGRVCVCVRVCLRVRASVGKHTHAWACACACLLQSGLWIPKRTATSSLQLQHHITSRHNCMQTPSCL